MKQTLSLFLDAVGRTIIGVVLKRTETELTVQNPAVVNIAQTQQNGIAVQVIPLIFREFIADKSESTTWTFQRARITEADPVVLDLRLTKQYEQVFGNDTVFITPGTQALPQPPTEDNNEKRIIRLFDDEDKK